MTAPERIAAGRGLRVLVCGGRDYANRDYAFATLYAIDQERGIACIIHGEASGADAIGKAWAIEHRRTPIGFPADWRTHGRAAGPMRNQRMLDVGRPDLVVAFPGGRGTADMVRRAKAAGVEVVEVVRRALGGGE